MIEKEEIERSESGERSRKAEGKAIPLLNLWHKQTLQHRS